MSAGSKMILLIQGKGTPLNRKLSGVMVVRWSR